MLGGGYFGVVGFMLFVLPEAMVEKDQQDDECSHASAIEVQFVFHQITLNIIRRDIQIIN